MHHVLQPLLLRGSSSDHWQRMGNYVKVIPASFFLVRMMAWRCGGARKTIIPENRFDPCVGLSAYHWEEEQNSWESDRVMRRVNPITITQGLCPSSSCLSSLRSSDAVSFSPKYRKEKVLDLVSKVAIFIAAPLEKWSHGKNWMWKFNLRLECLRIKFNNNQIFWFFLL